MRAITVEPGRPETLGVEEIDDPPADHGDILVEAIAMGVCGTDREIVEGGRGEPPPGHSRLVLGHESLGRVVEAPSSSGFAAGDLVVGIVRRPDPVPCGCCARGEFDLCANGRYAERGIKGLDGYGAERWRVPAEYAVKLAPELEDVGVLLEPASVLAKAWERIDRASRRCDPPTRVLITGAGPIGLLAALMAVQRELEVHVLDLATSGPKPDLSRGLGAEYHAGAVSDLDFAPDVIVECTGAGTVVVDSILATGANGVVCLTGVGPTGRAIPVDAAALGNELVLENGVVLGSVNANRRHYAQAAEALAQADQEWLRAVITRRVGLADIGDALERREDDVKVVVSFT